MFLMPRLISRTALPLALVLGAAKAENYDGIEAAARNAGLIK